jgi:hypothetical protein
VFDNTKPFEYYLAVSTIGNLIAFGGIGVWLRQFHQKPFCIIECVLNKGAGIIFSG